MFDKFKNLFSGKVTINDFTFEEAKSLDIVGGQVYINGELIEQFSDSKQTINVNVEGDVEIGELNVNKLNVTGNLSTKGDLNSNSIEVGGDFKSESVDCNSVSIKGNATVTTIDANTVRIDGKRN